ncbi:hypothetical protein [Trujillonella endophytica]|uniref:Uncharacterized protein n=1 Tax=Trujillonella endophytica TaxID=673521 RepID=A0A1H8WBM8_9ACTN|nr:hypothetical protein [Trujillella endophytica]SEP24913.1 hypothetical protein SAMN05660991_04266 [Trujillella endophytica]
MESHGIDRETAAAQLAALRTDRAALAERVLQPWWYDVALGLLLFGFLSTYVIDSAWMRFPALFVFLAGLGALVAVYRRRTGIWVNADAPAMKVWLVLVLVVAVPALVLAEGFDQRWAMVVAGAVLGVAVALLSRRWGRAYAAELREGEV